VQIETMAGINMEIEIQESGINKLIRLFCKILCYFLVLFGFLLICFQVLIFHNWLLILLGIVITTAGYLSKTRIAKIVEIKEDGIVLGIGNRNIEIRKEDISSVSKLVMITISRNFLLLINLRKVRFRVFNFYLVTNEPKYDFIQHFVKLGVKIRNI
jgi:hypothetical protein